MHQRSQVCHNLVLEQERERRNQLLQKKMEASFPIPTIRTGISGSLEVSAIESHA
jgi:hypothetical protein